MFKKSDFFKNRISKAKNSFAKASYYLNNLKTLDKNFLYKEKNGECDNV
jgi:hypothetical protein